MKVIRFLKALRRKTQHEAGSNEAEDVQGAVRNETEGAAALENP